jgi:hypothetical protein
MHEETSGSNQCPGLHGKEGSRGGKEHKYMEASTSVILWPCSIKCTLRIKDSEDTKRYEDIQGVKPWVILGWKIRTFSWLNIVVGDSGGPLIFS